MWWVFWHPCTPGGPLAALGVCNQLTTLTFSIFLTENYKKTAPFRCHLVEQTGVSITGQNIPKKRIWQTWADTTTNEKKYCVSCANKHTYGWLPVLGCREWTVEQRADLCVIRDAQETHATLLQKSCLHNIFSYSVWYPPYAMLSTRHHSTLASDHKMPTAWNIQCTVFVKYGLQSP